MDSADLLAIGLIVFIFTIAILLGLDVRGLI